MKVVSEIPELRESIATLREAGGPVALVPTMGNIHAGHLSLVRRARADCAAVAVSLYVNPFQFGAGEDLATYPRTEAADRAALAGEGVDLLFLPDDRVMYPRGLEQQTRVEVPHLGSALEGASRPGFFRGVATVVNRLLNIVGPDVAYFGKKDFQQLVVIKCMVADLAIPVEIVGVETVRDPDGLALSSRNGYLTPAERGTAPALYAGLCRGVELVKSGACAASEVERVVADQWRRAGLSPDYASVRRPSDLAPPGPGDRQLVMLGAAFVGATRLIDNVEFEL